ncbi:YbhB/YbcL family Raf kinase inhibitor-like protein [Ilumatobacter nonamiensis]|uniref:YbhB/YbcL family Raf kinase inhibitor-like protein n=1 Tax=Ilumatobacter nonamiensis TaxID=467093 RepID=UPI00034ABCF8|nr:YbhB/YbcL family Raf kinase inhibitor-like protein [Ilumatobacter nonamiensis]
MSDSSPVTRPRRFLTTAAVTIAGVVALAGCDTGDGTTLREPTAPTTLPPPETTLPGEPVAEASVSSTASFDTVPIEIDDIESVPPPDTGAIELTMPWADGAAVDIRYTCDGNNAAPAITWTGMPEETVEVAVAMVNESDLTAGRPFIQWVMAGIDPSLDGLAENEVPAGAVQGINFFGDVGYTGPCPDPGTVDDYTFTVFAVEQQLELADETPAAQMLDVILTVAIDSGSSSSFARR